MFRATSISTKTFIVFAALLSCFVALGADAYFRMGATIDRLAVVRDDMLPRQAAVQKIVDDVASTHMRVLRFVMLASDPTQRDTVTTLSIAISLELAGEEAKLRHLASQPQQLSAKAEAVHDFVTHWEPYAVGVRKLLVTALLDASDVQALGRALDEKFIAISAWIRPFSWYSDNEAAALLTSARNDAVANRIWLMFGVFAGTLIGLLIAAAFARSIVRPVRAVTRAMNDVSSGVADVDLGYADRGDEIGQMVKSITAFRATTQQHVDTIASQKRVLNAALDNMSHGLCMFDPDERLTVCNERYLEIMGVPQGLIAPGCTFGDMQQVLRAANITTEAEEQRVVELRNALASGHTVRTMRKLTDGRAVEILSRPLAGGGWVATHEDVTDRLAAEERIAHMARHDALTDLPNRVCLREELQRALARVHRGEMLALHYVDFDHFKNINDTLGHLVGDELLKAAATRLRGCVREVDNIARLGGDEFAIVQTGIEEPGDAAALAQRIQEAMRTPFHLDDHLLTIDASIGIAMAPADGTGVEELLKSADMAAYAAKADGRGIYRFFELEMDQRVKERRSIETGLRQALANGEFRLHYQPIVNLQSNRISSLEALIRWFHPERGLVPPADFIPVAEECGMIGPIGEWVLRQACHDAAGWPDDIKVAVNLSPAQFTKGLVQSVVSALASAGLPARRLELEITESVLMQNTFSTLAALNQLHDLGVKFSMDDFGTGYSSLSYLRSFPFDKIKIDRSFVTDLSQHENSSAIIRAVTILARSLDMVTTVEGVETQAQCDHVKALGCTEMQGYLYSPPRGVEDIARLFLQAPDKASDDADATPAASAA